ncbi:MAG: nucleoside-diphosphate kinase [Kiritimatiellia bacterium]
MAKELAFVLINPYTIGKSRTGGVIGRYIRTGLDLVGARIFGPSRALTEKYAAMIREDQEVDEDQRDIIADYVLRTYMPDSKNNRRHRVFMLLFEGDNAIDRIREATGKVRYNMTSGRTVRDIYGDYVTGPNGQVLYVEPAVLIGPTAKSCAATLKLWAEYSAKDGGIIADAFDLADDNIEKTLVLIKPDNFRFPSSRAGNIIDLFSGSGLRIVGAKLHQMSVGEAEEFYGPVREFLRKKFKGSAGEQAYEALSKKFGVAIPESMKEQLGEMFGPLVADHQFYKIIEFMTGWWAPSCGADGKECPGKSKCLALVYAGENAISKIRDILGPTDPSKAQPGSVRKEFGSDVMVNAAHASDSPENAAREMKIIKVEQDTIKKLVQQYYP